MSIKYKLKLFSFVSIIAFVFSASLMVSASDNMQILIEKIRADKKLFIAQNMQLTDAEADAFWPIYEKYQDELFLLRARTKNLILVYAENFDHMNDEIAKKLLDEHSDIEESRQKLRNVYLPKFRKVLPDIKVVRYYQIENKINAVLMYEIAANVPLIPESH